MTRRLRGIALSGSAALLVLAAVSLVARGRPVAVDQLPASLTDRAFWRLVTEFSEPDGYFRSDNFLSNEINFQRVIPTLVSTLRAGGVYLGVGPEQNFTYIAALKPRIAFIVDIRRQNMLEHLLYKAFMEVSSDRADFLARLFARPRPPGLGSASTAEELFEAFAGVEGSEALYKQNLHAAIERLDTQHRFVLSDDDKRKIERVYTAFYSGGVDLNYSFSPGGVGFWRGRMPTYADLMTASDDAGVHRSYLATEDGFRLLKKMEADNRVIPLVGDFGGPRALRAVGRYLKDHGATVTVFYTSNVEQYLFQDPDLGWKKFYANVATLPIDGQSTFIRSASAGWSRPPAVGRSTPLLCPIGELLKAFHEDHIASYGDVLAMSK